MQLERLLAITGQANQWILKINTGSSSLKVGLYDVGQGETRLLSGEAERISDPVACLRLNGADGAALIDQRGSFPDHGAALEALLVGLKYNRHNNGNVLWTDWGNVLAVHKGGTWSILDGVVSTVWLSMPRVAISHAGNSRMPRQTARRKLPLVIPS
jgi:hypothetical protein